jgi:hypothetical protein
VFGKINETNEDALPPVDLRPVSDSFTENCGIARDRETALKHVQLYLFCTTVRPPSDAGMRRFTLQVVRPVFLENPWNSVRVLSCSGIPKIFVLLWDTATWAVFHL